MSKKNSDKPTVEIWTDGSCLGNPGVGGWAAVLEFDNGKDALITKVLSGSLKPTTNNRAELMAIIYAIGELKKPCNVILHCDSEYAMNTVNRTWKAKKNHDLIKTAQNRIDQNGHSVEWKSVRAHNGDENNERADTLAQARARDYKDLGHFVSVEKDFEIINYAQDTR